VGDDQIPPQFSPDGRYWWDGEQWLPVDQLPKPLTDIPQEEYEAPRRARGGGRSPLLPILAVGVVVVVVIAAVGFLAMTGRIHLFGPSPQPTPTGGGVPSPSTAVYIPGMTLQSWTGLATQAGLSCADLSEDVPNLAGFCQLNQNNVVRRMVVYGHTNQQISTVRVVYRDDTKRPDANAAAQFLAQAATVQYQGANPSQAAAWVRSHPNGTTSIGGITFRTHVEAQSHRWVLDIFPQGR
jgi:hypothetical protein